MNGEKQKVAIIGCGMIANKAHIPAWKSHSDRCEVVAVCSHNPATAEQTAGRWDIPHVYPDAESMLRAERPDIVSVCAPNGLHKSMTLLALSYGANVFCEKPVALSYADAREMYGAAAAAGKALMACQVLRCSSEYRFARECWENGTLGDVYYSEFSLIRRRGVPKWGEFHRKSASGGGVFCDLGVHMVDAALWVSGNPRVKAVSGCASSYLAKNEHGVLTSLKESGAPAGVFTQKVYRPEEFEVEEFAAGCIRLENGGSLNFKTSWAVNLPNEYRMTLSGTKAGLLLPEMKLLSTMGRYQADISPRLFPDEEPYAGEAFPGHFVLAGNLLDHVLEDAPLMVQPEQTLEVTAVIEAFYRSAAENREVALSEITGE